MMRQRWGLGTVVWVSGVAAALIVACSGDDIPPISNEERDAFEEIYGDDSVGAAGASMSGVAGNGTGTGGRGGSGSGGRAPVGGSGGGGTVVGGGGSGSSGTPCNAPVEVFAVSCAYESGCHGVGSPLGDFAASEAAALEYVDAPGSFGASCGLWIDSSNPEESAILTKTVNPVDAACGQRMPLRGDFLTPQQEACVLSWLSQFAD